MTYMATDPHLNVAELRDTLADTINRAIQGKPTIITNRGRPVAALVPLATYLATQSDETAEASAKAE